eukprot:Hpha_TRINITY_DN15763_c2_g2::TRINITY_DN15763_c2_g2_i1::g.36951::m.36951
MGNQHRDVVPRGGCPTPLNGSFSCYDDIPEDIDAATVSPYALTSTRRYWGKGALSLVAEKALHEKCEEILDEVDVKWLVVRCLQGRRELARWAASRWRDFVRRRRAERMQQQQPQQLSLAERRVSVPPVADLSSPPYTVPLSEDWEEESLSLDASAADPPWGDPKAAVLTPSSSVYTEGVGNTTPGFPLPPPPANTPEVEPVTPPPDQSRPPVAPPQRQGRVDPCKGAQTPAQPPVAKRESKVEAAVLAARKRAAAEAARRRSGGSSGRRPLPPPEGREGIKVQVAAPPQRRERRHFSHGSSLPGLLA